MNKKTCEFSCLALVVIGITGSSFEMFTTDSVVLNYFIWILILIDINTTTPKTIL